MIFCPFHGFNKHNFYGDSPAGCSIHNVKICVCICLCISSPFLGLWLVKIYWFFENDIILLLSENPHNHFAFLIQTAGVWVAVSHISIIRCVPPLIPIVWQHSWQNMPVMIEWSCSVIFYSANYLHYLVITNKTFICYDYTSYYYGLYWGLHQATPHHTTIRSSQDTYGYLSS